MIILSIAFCEQLHAQFFFFGKNRVQYDQFDWRFIETDHFDIYYYNSKNYHLAQFTAESLESSLKQLLETFDHNLTNRIPVIIYDSHSKFQQTNVVPLPIELVQFIGGVTDKAKNRMTQPFMGDYIDFRRTLQHELLHAVVNDFFFGGSLQSIIQNNIQLQLPLFFEEGLAEFMAQGWDTETDTWYRDAVINDNLPPLPRVQPYRGGQGFWRFVEEVYGRPKITEILQRVKSTRSVGQAFVVSLGLSIEELSERWQEFYKQRYFPEIEGRQTLSSISTAITRRGRGGSTFNSSPALTPQGDRIAYITNRRSGGGLVFDVVVANTNTGEILKTLIKGEDSPSFEGLNVLNPNLGWSPDGSKLALSSLTEGTYSLAIVDYETGKPRMIKFPSLDAITSVAWSPDGKKIAFDGNDGPYQNIYVYNLETGEFLDLTGDVFQDQEPAWGPDSETVYFVSNRGSRLTPHKHLAGYSILQHESTYQRDLYSIRLDSDRIVRLTNTPNADETQPKLTRDGRMLFVSDINGIKNIYEYDLETRTTYPITNVQTGIEQISVTADGGRLAFMGINEGFRGIHIMRSPFTQRISGELKPNNWALERAQKSPGDLVPAIRYVKEMLEARPKGNVIASVERLRQLAAPPVEEDPDEMDIPEEEAEEEEEKEEEVRDRDVIDFRNYEFGEAVVRDTTIELRDDPRQFQPDQNLTEEGLYQPRDYRLSFSPDFTFSAGQIDTRFGTSAFFVTTLSDLLGDHQIAIASNLQFDLRNSDYTIQYAYLKNRTNYFATFFHQAQNFQTFFGELLRFRTFGLGGDAQYPLNRFQRVDVGLSFIGINRDFSSVQGFTDRQLSNDSNQFLFPNASFTGDFTLPGFITPQGGTRYKFQISGSPAFGTDAPEFFSVFGDYRKYLNLGQNYSIALRASGAASFGPDSQTFLLGGLFGWLNPRFSDSDIPLDRLADTFFTVRTAPLRGHEFNTLFGDRYSLLNAEFRFPLFAALLPGPIPFLPLFNTTGVAFIDAGAAWGFDTVQTVFNPQTGREIETEIRRTSGLDFRVGKRRTVEIDPRDGSIIENGNGQGIPTTFFDGDIAIGAGFGIRTILLGLPFRYDVGWPFERTKFGGNEIHMISIGIDF
ncbi:MAG: hypothetical protein ACFCU6_06800 [Balneolaceae bacterium]